MATYKVIQDVEAEDKILGPLTLRQFIYAGITVILLYLSYLVASKGLLIIMPVFFLPAVVFGFFAFPWGRDQPTEVWALAKIRFLFKPRRRIWDQSGAKQLVTITAPKIVQEAYFNQISQTEVKSRLRALADTIDSRGWAIKTASVPNTFGTQSPAPGQVNGSSDRLLNISAAPAQPTITSDVQAADDIMDEQANPLAQKVDSMISASAQAHRQKLIDELNAPPPTTPKAPPADYWFLNQPSQPANAPRGSVTFGTQVVEPGTTQDGTQVTQTVTPAVDEAAIVHELEEHKEEGPNSSYYGHLKTIQPLSVQRQQATQKAAQAPVQPLPPLPTPPVTPTQQAAILQLARNDDLNVATIAREANKNDDGEVVIQLH